MKISDIKALAELVRKNNLSALDLSEGELHIRIENAPAPQSAPAPEAAAPQEAAPVPAPAPAPAVDNGPDFGAARMIVSPMVGVFYASPSPDDPPFVKVGQKVHKGDVLCIIEAMKLMNEITAEEDGEIIDVCAANGSVVEYGQTLFKLL
ncbi:MAG: acetyl-CoA carboxylase biotin carboxyl carrier protein [Candidatus Spyradocola sp.]|nr:acetyl-CoA carboxylase biotin carboxyl carrier protein [Candidatus Spyradocola sp.]